MIGWLFSWCLAITGTCYGWLNPFYGLMVYYALSTLRPPYTWFWSFNKYNPPQLIQYVALSALLGWMFGGFGDSVNWRWIKVPMLGLGLYLLSGVIAWKMFAVNPGVAWDYLNTQLKIGLMSLVTILVIKSEKQVRIFTWVIVASLCYLGWTFNQWYRIDPLYLWRNGWGGVDNNGVAMVMVMGVPLGFFKGIHDKRLWVKGLLFVGTASMIHVVLFSYSRGGQLGLCMVGAVLFIFALVALPRKLITLTLAVLFVMLTLRLAGSEVRARFWTIFADEGERDASAASRFSTWSAAWRCIQDHPFGVGPRCFNSVSHLYGLAPNKSVHNLFLQTGADYGIPGAIGLGIFYLGTMIQCFFTSISATAKRLVWPRYHCQMVTVSIAGFLVCSQFIGMESVEMAFMIALVGLITVAYVKRVAANEAATEGGMLPELEDVPKPSDVEEELAASY